METTTAGRKPFKEFNFLEIGEETELTGKYKKYVYQYVYQFNNGGKRADGKKLQGFKRDNRIFIKRIA